MANLPLTSTNGLPITGVLGKPVVSSLMMCFFATSSTFALYDINDINYDIHTEWELTRYVTLHGNFSVSPGACTACDLVEANYHGGWAWHGSYWEYILVSWDYISGGGSPSPVTVTVFCNQKQISKTFSRSGYPYFTPFNPRDCQIGKVRYTPSTDVLEFI